tara:strand:- start:66 stop:254 length:189 start_codon:yes stop_codon:yes gene_type:complete
VNGYSQDFFIFDLSQPMKVANHSTFIIPFNLFLETQIYENSTENITARCANGGLGTSSRCFF